MKNSWIGSFTGCLLTLIAQQLLADGKIDDKPGLGLKLYLSVGYRSDQSQFNTNSDNEITEDLDNGGESTDGVGLLPLARVDYTLSNLKTQFFLGQGGENIVRGQLQYELGFRHLIGQREALELAYSPRLPGFKKTWSDPYVTGVAREETDESAHSFRMRWRNVRESPLTLRFGYASNSVDDEESGIFLGLSENQREKLDRNGDYFRLTGEYDIYKQGTTTVTPLASYTRGQTEGAAMGYNGIRVGLEAKRVFYKRHFASLFIDFEYRKHLDSNPVFDKTQIDQDIGLTATYAYVAPFGWEHARILALAKFDRTSSNIGFFEAKSRGVAIGLGYEF